MIIKSLFIELRGTSRTNTLARVSSHLIGMLSLVPYFNVLH